MPLANGQILNNRYRIEAWVGSGAFADVYRAIHVELDTPRALKVGDLGLAQTQEAGGVRIGLHYPAPLVNHASARPQVLQAYRRV